MLGSFKTKVSSLLGKVIRSCRGDNGDLICFNRKGALLTIVTVDSGVGSASERTIGRLGRDKGCVMLLANSNRLATRGITKRVSTGHFVSSTLPISGRGIVGRLRTRKEIMTVMNSNVGSSRTLTHTSMDVTVNGNASVTVSMTVIALVASSLLLLPGTFGLSRGAMHLVRRGLF